MRNLRSINTALHGSVLVLAVLCLTLGSIACSSGNSGEGAKWGTIGKGSVQKSPAFFPQSHSSVLDLPLDGTLRGTVRDEEGQPLEGVTVYAVVPGDPHVFGMMTDTAGQYEIKFPKKRATEVQFSMLGKETVTLPIGKKKKIDVVLKNEALELDSGYLDQPTGTFRIVQ